MSDTAASVLSPSGPIGSSKAPSWRAVLAPYARPDLGRSLLDIVTSVVTYLGLLVAMYFLLDVSYWLVLAVSMPAAGFLVRTYIVFHDCAHGSFLPWSKANEWLGVPVGCSSSPPFVLASTARGPSRVLGRPRPARRRRRPNAHGRGVPRAAAAPPARLPAGPQPDRDVRARADLGDDPCATLRLARGTRTDPPQRLADKPRARCRDRAALLAARLGELPAR